MTYGHVFQALHLIDEATPFQLDNVLQAEGLSVAAAMDLAGMSGQKLAAKPSSAGSPSLLMTLEM